MKGRGKEASGFYIVIHMKKRYNKKKKFMRERERDRGRKIEIVKEKRCREGEREI